MRLSWRAAFETISRHRPDSADQALQNPIIPSAKIMPAIYPSLAGKVVMVTGGASGIGEEIVRSFAAQGARVGFVDIQADRGTELADELQSAGHSVSFFSCDLKDIDAFRAAADRMAATFGPITILVNNAANDERHDWAKVTPAYFDERLATNLRHFFFAIQMVAPGMMAARNGSIINLGSIAAWEGDREMTLYSAAKAAIHGLTRSFARDLGRHRIRVNTVVPGWVMTERQRRLWASPEALTHHLRRQCLPDPVHPIHVACLVLFLASDDSAMCTAGSYLVEAGVLN